MIKRNKMNTNRLITIAVCAMPVMAMAQGTADDYNRAYQLREKYSARHIYNDGVKPYWTGKKGDFWYTVNTRKGCVYNVVNPNNGNVTKRPLFDSKKLAETLGKAGVKATAEKLWLDRLRTTENFDTLHFDYSGSMWRYIVSRDMLTKEGSANRPEKPRNERERYWSETDDERSSAPAVSPDGRYRAYIFGNNVRIEETATGRITAQTLDGSQGEYYSSYIYWSPDSRRIALCKIKTAPKHYIYYVESSPNDQFEPKLHKQEYQKPGDMLPYKTPVIIEAATGRKLTAETTLFPDEFGLDNICWQPDGSDVTFEYNQRGHKIYRLLAMSAVTGRVRTVVEESFPTYVNYTRIFRHHFADGRRLIWSSERDGYNHLYLYDKNTGKAVRQITKGPWYVRGVQHIDEKKGLIYFSANGREKNEDPYFIHYYRIGLDGRNLTCLTPEKATHTATFSPDYSYMVDVYSTVKDAPVAVLRNTTDVKVVTEIERTDIADIVKNGWRAPEVFTAKGRDGKTDIWGLIYRPTNYDASKKYPVIDYIYSGPGDQYVPKRFIAYDWWATSLAELGFIVVKVDGMTTSFRSKKFEEVCYKNLKDGGLPDHEAWIRAAAAKYAAIDTSRVGIYGCSAGGQEAMNAVLLHPDFYKAAYAASGCHDNRMDKIWWNEQWLGYPVDSSYIEGSNIENAHLLRRPLMLCWGELDNNVDPATTMKVVAALQKADKDFEMIVIPGGGHTMGELWGEHKRYDFFVRHLMGINPPEWKDVKSDVAW